MSTSGNDLEHKYKVTITDDIRNKTIKEIIKEKNIIDIRKN